MPPGLMGSGDRERKAGEDRKKKIHTICFFSKRIPGAEGAGDRLSKNLYNEKGHPPYPYQSAKSRDLCVAFCTSQGASVRQRRAYSPLQKLEKVA